MHVWRQFLVPKVLFKFNIESQIIACIKPSHFEEILTAELKISLQSSFTNEYEEFCGKNEPHVMPYSLLEILEQKSMRLLQI